MAHVPSLCADSGPFGKPSAIGLITLGTFLARNAGLGPEPPISAPYYGCGCGCDNVRRLPEDL